MDIPLYHLLPLLLNLLIGAQVPEFFRRQSLRSHLVAEPICQILCFFLIKLFILQLLLLSNFRRRVFLGFSHLNLRLVYQVYFVNFQVLWWWFLGVLNCNVCKNIRAVAHFLNLLLSLLDILLFFFDVMFCQRVKPSRRLGMYAL